MKRFIFYLLFLVLGTTNGISQKNKFWLAPQLGFINGDHNVDGSLLLSGGVEIKKFQYGITTGFDYYKFRTIPVYAEAKRLFGAASKKPFIYAGAGLNIAYPLENQHSYNPGWGWGWTEYTPSKFSNGYFAEGGLGVMLENKKGKGFMMSLGYSSKTLKESWKENIWDPVSSTIIATPKSDQYTLNRIVFKLGFRIF